MKGENRLYRMYLEDILISMERISEYISDHDFESFKKDYKTVDAVIRNFEVIGEASKNLPDSLKVNYGHIPWQEMYYLRNKISHEYFGIDYSIIWDLSKNYIPQNITQIQEILKKEQ